MNLHRIKSLVLSGVLIGLVGVALSIAVEFFTGFSVPTYVLIVLVSVVCGIVAANKFGQSPA